MFGHLAELIFDKALDDLKEVEGDKALATLFREQIRMKERETGTKITSDDITFSISLKRNDATSEVDIRVNLVFLPNNVVRLRKL